ncbi:MAG: hypothetical protein GX981_07610 [Tissierellia bacterium]|nr:hypothetical protein [Tissierellia bacterium]
MKNKSYTDLVNEIVNTYHKYFQREMPEISKLTSTILRVHGREHRELRIVHRLFNNTKTILEEILIIKEVDIFPYIKMYDRKPSKELLNKILYNINELEKEYREIENKLKELRQVTNNYTAPEDGCNTYDKTFEKLEEFENNIMENIYLEKDLFSKLK